MPEVSEVTPSSSEPIATRLLCVLQSTPNLPDGGLPCLWESAERLTAEDSTDLLNFGYKCSDNYG